VQYLNGRSSPLRPSAHRDYDAAMLASDPAVLLSLANVRYVVTSVSPHNRHWDAGGLTEIARLAAINLRILRVDEVLDRVALVPAAIHQTTLEGLARSITDHGGPRRVVATTARQPSPGDERREVSEVAGGTVVVTREHPETVHVRMTSPHETAFLLFNESYYPGWSASLDGKPADLLAANMRFMMVSVPRGEHEVVFEYRSTWLPLGLCISAIGGLLLAALLWRAPLVGPHCISRAR